MDVSQPPDPATPPTTVSVLDKLLLLEGILKETYRELGGAEVAILEERGGYSR
ncbi:MAG: hypothetical protein JNK48_22655, partial [Bryobacterales bacterium]|nr:hypothetical protein [Bryobacterales bacterium]